MIYDALGIFIINELVSNQQCEVKKEHNVQDR